MSIEEKSYLVCGLVLGEEEAQAVAEVVRSKWLSVGPKTAAFEAAFAESLGVGGGPPVHAVSVSNCTAALHLALLAVGVGPGDEVLVPSYTFVASANAVLYCGATPVFVDIVGPEDLNLDPQDLASKITDRSKAVVVVHMAGFLADMDQIMDIAESHNLKVVEDACHAIGAAYQSATPQSSPHHGRMAGTIGDAGCFSFFANKNLVTGEGGMVVTRSADVAGFVRLGRSHGMTKTSWDRASGRAESYDVVQLGFNYRGTELNAALGLIQLRKLDAFNRKRMQLVEVYRQQITRLGLPVVLPFARRIEDSAHHILPIVLPRPELVATVRRSLTELKVQTTHHYPSVHRFSHYEKLLGEKTLPRTEHVSACEVTLPLHPLLEVDDVKEIVNRLGKALSIRGALPAHELDRRDDEGEPARATKSLENAGIDA